MTNPLNKGNSRRLPQINNRFTIAALAAADNLTKGVRRRLRRPVPVGLDEKFQRHIFRALRTTPAGNQLAESMQVVADAQQAFGKPTLVSFDVILTLPADDVDVISNTALFRDLLIKGTQVVWDNPEVYPAAIRGRVLAGSSPLLDMTGLGFADEIARPADLYQHFGPPAADPRWHP